MLTMRFPPFVPSNKQIPRSDVPARICIQRIVGFNGIQKRRSQFMIFILLKDDTMSFPRSI